MLFILSFVVALILTFASNPLINLVYGKEYARSSNILMIHLWAGIFMFSRALFSKWILIEGKLYFSLLSNLFGAIVNVALNYILIPKYGGIGAAISTLFSYATASYFILFFNRDTYQLAKMISISFLSPFRYTFNAYKVFRK
jgi:O-antigen/teichoic acid export membrane protein